MPPIRITRYLPHAIALTLVATAGLIEYHNGRLPLGPDHTFGLWEGNIWSSECSQRIADAYSFSHLIHGILFFAFLWLIGRRLPLRWRFLIAVIIETSWELLENSTFMIDRYRQGTMALGYEGDSILNSMSDILMMSLGFLFASKVPWKISLLVVLILEVGCALWIRDNLTLNVIMLIHPVDAIKAWQMGGMPTP